MKKTLFALLVIVSGVSFAAPMQNLVANAGFSADLKNWKLECSDTGSDWLATWSETEGHGPEGGSLEMRSGKYARVRAISAPMVINGGDQVVVTAWIRGDSETTIMPGTIGAVLRLTPMNARALPVDEAIYLPLRGEAVTGAERGGLLQALDKVPVEWTRIQHDVTIPADVRGVRLELMTFRTSGKVWWDDVSVTLKP
jgi:hypothetical protein